MNLRDETDVAVDQGPSPTNVDVAVDDYIDVNDDGRHRRRFRRRSELKPQERRRRNCKRKMARQSQRRNRR